MKQVEKRSNETERREPLDILCTRSALLLSVLCCIAPYSLGTQNTGTSPTDITLSNKLRSDGDRNTPKITTGQ